MTTTLYLEQYLASLESLPGELRRNFSLMHDMDVKNRDILQKVDASADEYLRKVRELSSDQRKKEMEKIQAMFQKARDHGDEKVSIAIQTYELVDKHIRKLDSDLAKFEAEMKEKGRLSQTETEDDDDDEDRRTKLEKGKKKRKNAKDTKLPAGQKGKKKNQIADEDTKKGKKKKAGASSKGDSGGLSSQTGGSALGPLPGLAGMIPGVSQEALDMPVDPNEPTYCLCQQVSYGEMIGCDNNDCTIEWFHFGCMGLTTKPKGKWYCPKCITLFKKKK